MDISEYISEKAAVFVQASLDKSNIEMEQIKYGIQSILTNTFKMIILFITAYFLGIAKYTLIALVAFGILRSFASGIHATSSLKCIIANYIIFLGNVYLSIYFTLTKLNITVLFLISLVLITFYAPADTAARPLTSTKTRKKLKTLSIITTVLLYILAIILKNNIYVNIVTFSACIEAILITPLAYKIFNLPYRNYKKYENKISTSSQSM